MPDATLRDACLRRFLKYVTFDTQSDEANRKSAEKIHPHHRWELAMTVFQIAISLASITILTRMRWLFVTSGLAGIAGLGLAAAAWLHL